MLALRSIKQHNDEVRYPKKKMITEEYMGPDRKVWTSKSFKKTQNIENSLTELNTSFWGRVNGVEH